MVPIDGCSDTNSIFPIAITMKRDKSVKLAHDSTFSINQGT